MADENAVRIIHGNDQFDEEVLRAKEPVLVDFFATWCGPCRAIAPALDAVARKLAGRARVVKVNVDEDSDLAQRYDVSAIPSLVIFREGGEVRRMVGLTPKSRIASALDDASAPAA